MATRPAWRISKVGVERMMFEFVFNPGFAEVQKKKNVAALHEAIGQKALEVSTKSSDEFGKRLSAFNLTLGGIPLECVFQSSKVYENGGPYKDLLHVSPKCAKKDERHKTSGKLIAFEYNGIKFPLEPKTVFYDYIYAMAVKEKFTKDELKQLDEYVWFTDIEFNPNKSINCQAEAITLVKAMIQMFGEVPNLEGEQGFKDFISFYRMKIKALGQ